MGFARLGLGSYMILAVPFAMVGSATPYVIFLLWNALVAIGTTAAGCALRALLDPRRKQQSEK